MELDPVTASRVLESHKRRQRCPTRDRKGRVSHHITRPVVTRTVTTWLYATRLLPLAVLDLILHTHHVST